MTDAIVTLGGQNILIGHLRFDQAGHRQHSAFTYDESWLENDRAFAIDPEAIPLSAAPSYATSKNDPRDAIHSVFADSAPDSWGRKLMQKAYGKHLNEFDYLTLADDRTRQGALRFLGKDMNPLSGNGPPVPRVIELEELAALTRKFERDPDGAEEDARQLAGAIGSLGGARPKANVLDGDNLWIAKFSSINDQSPVEQVEIATLNMARDLGIRVPEARLELRKSQHPVALIRRFDRNGRARVPYISGRTALQLPGTDLGYYSDLAEFLRRHGSRPVDDCNELWVRLVFTILVRNTDDHMKNHGFIYDGGGQWRLSPAFDINPQPERNPQLKSGISQIHGFEPSIAAVLDAAPLFEVDPDQATESIVDMATFIDANWRKYLGDQELSGKRLTQFAPAFEHDEMTLALSLKQDE